MKERAYTDEKPQRPSSKLSRVLKATEFYFSFSKLLIYFLDKATKARLHLQTRVPGTLTFRFHFTGKRRHTDDSAEERARNATCTTHVTRNKALHEAINEEGQFRDARERR